MLAWLVKKGLLEVRVGVMRHGEGIVHAKFGIVTDGGGESIVFSGSGNESAQGLAANYERLEVSTSWEDRERYDEYAKEFESLWNDRHPDVHTLTLPEALRLKLIKLAPRKPPVVEPSSASARQKAAMIWRFLVESPYLSEGGTACNRTAMVDLWPHQERVVEEAAAAWPEGRLLCDEVGMGKTIEAILALRRLLAGRGVRRVLLLLPAGLLKQWQGELREKGGLIFPRLDGTSNLVWPDERMERVEGLAEALRQDALLLSRETARTENNFPSVLDAEPWDLVILDEAHAARRRQQEEGEFNKGTLLLDLLRRMQLQRKARGFLLLSATPMQTHPWEPWDLLSVLGEGGRWLSEFAGVRDYYGAIAAIAKGRCDLDTARRAAALISADPQFPPPSPGAVPIRDREKIAHTLAFAMPTERVRVSDWLRRGSPLGRRMHRNTRTTLRQYYAMGLLDNEPAARKVEDIRFDYQDRAERRVYDSVTAYIDKRFAELEQEKPGKGFVMTIYRRRASSSPVALRCSLERRRDGLVRVIERKAFDPDLGRDESMDRRDLDDLGEADSSERISAALPANPQVARSELEDVVGLLADLQSLGSRDSKRDRFFDELRRITEDGRPVLVFTEYTDTMDYLRDTLVPHYGKTLACYSGDGGQVWHGESWQAVTKDAITDKLHRGEL
ncbi:MAG: SNF2-related protein, partial [Acidobacteriota bacterium]